MLGISAQPQVFNKRTNFKGSAAQNENGIPYHKSSEATKLGAGIGAAALGLGALGAGTLKELNIPELTEEQLLEIKNELKSEIGNENFEKTIVDLIKEKNDLIKKTKKYALPMCALSGLMHLGCGATIDYLRNKEAAKSANTLAKLGAAEALAKDRNLQVSEYNKIYYNSDTGAKYGALLGVGFSIISQLLDKFFIGKKANMPYRIGQVFMSGLAGWGVGALADHFINKDAKKG